MGAGGVPRASEWAWGEAVDDATAYANLAVAVDARRDSVGQLGGSVEYRLVFLFLGFFYTMWFRIYKQTRTPVPSLGNEAAGLRGVGRRVSSVGGASEEGTDNGSRIPNRGKKKR